MRFALLSDIHGNLAALEAVTSDLATRKVDWIANLGDSLSGPLLPQETAEFLMRQDWIHLAGNHERQVLKTPPELQGASDAYARTVLHKSSLEWIAGLRDTQAVGPDIFLCHGTPRSDCTYLLETVTPTGIREANAAEIRARCPVSATFVACGHSHVPRSIKLDQGQVFVNPGSAGLAAYDDHHPYFHFVETRSPDARYAIVERHDNTWTCTLLSIPYDFEPMARLAEQRKRPDWAHALRTGCNLVRSLVDSKSST